jgi:16S rRNA (cytidine1402-2'-O)-methyltransferase
MAGKLFLLPNYLSESQDKSFVAPMVCDVIQHLDYYLAENTRTSRRFISSLHLGIDISVLQFEEINKHFDPKELPRIFDPVFSGKDIGLQSEAGLPGIADPGKLAVSYAHDHGIEVVALPGSSSIILGLISSGFNGQEFTFHGYLPIDKNTRSKKIKSLETEALKTGYTQVFMETPYRNRELLNSLLNTLHPGTSLFIGADITGSHQTLRTFTVKEWQKEIPDLHKIPAIFAIGLAPMSS